MKAAGGSRVRAAGGPLVRAARGPWVKAAGGSGEGRERVELRQGEGRLRAT